MTMQGRDRGAAMVIAISIMTILLAIALTFFAVTRRELQVATNVTNTVRVDHLADAAVAIAIAHLNQDVFKNPRATSMDHAAFSIFNGAWIAGKPWAMRNNIPLWQGGLPEINLNRLPFPALTGVQQPLYVKFADKHTERLYLGPRSRDWLFYPRVEHSSGSVMIDRPVLYDREAVLLDATQVFLPDDQQVPLPENLYLRYDPSLRPGQSVGSNRAPNYFPFVTSDFYGRVLAPDGNTYVILGGDPLFPIPPAEFDTGLGGDGGAQYPLEQIHAWADVDNDGDGLNDSIWVPIPIDVFFPDDGIDNNLTGIVFEDPSPGIFVYWGGDDGLDNNGNGIVDGPDEQKYFLTAPLPGLVIPVDLYNSGIPGTKVIDLDDNEEKPLKVILPSSISVRVQARSTEGDLLFLPDGSPNIVDIGLTNADVDILDNDYNMIVNDFYVYAYIGPNPYNGGPPFFNARNANDTEPLFLDAKERGYKEINVETVLGYDNLRFDPPNATLPDGRPLNFQQISRSIKITHSGEPVCDLAGRAAVLIRDEASKVNLNVAGGHSYTGDPVNPMRRALGEGATPHEYETRVLPQVQFARASKLWGVLTGSPEGAVLPVSTAQMDYLGAPGEEAERGARLGPYYWDLSFPGYGRVDDNANALILAFSGRDDSGSGLIDEGLNLPELSPEAEAVLEGNIAWTEIQPVARRDAVVDELSWFKAYFDRLGLFEGIDEPAELQRFRPRRNLLAERDGLDNDDNGVAGEFGELGDRQLQNLEQIQLALSNEEVPLNLANRLRNFATVHSTDRNTGYIDTDRGLRAVNRLDFNLATPQQIAAHLIIHGDFSPITRITDELGDFLLAPENTPVRRFSEGLRQADIHLEAPGGLLFFQEDPLPAPPTPTVYVLPADPLLQALELAVDIVDSRDRDYARSVLTTEKTKLIPQRNFDPDTTYWPERLTARESIPQSDLMPIEEIEEHMVNTLGIKDPTGYPLKALQAVDQWWDNLVDPPQARRISYTAAGTEAIRINEIMVRPVRRVEAEAVTVAVSNEDPMFMANHDNFNPSPYSGFPEFAVFRRDLQQALSGIGENLFPWQWGGDYLGDGAAIILNAPNPTFTVPYNEIPPLAVQVPRVMQFVFQATEPFDPTNPATNPTPEGLPPGRYYLTMKARDILNNRDLREGDILYAIKYVRLGGVFPYPEQEIVDDMAQVIGQIRGELQPGLPVLPPETMPPPACFQGVLDDTKGYYFDNNWKTLEDWQIAKTPGAPPGWIFLDCGPTPASDPLYNFNYFGEFYAGAPQPATPNPVFPHTHTVMIPPLDSGWALCVAIAPNPCIPEPLQLAIDSFDFSQEPNHEYVEIVNISDHTVDVSGWELEVGIPDRPLVTKDPFKTKGRIPNGVTIEPGGKRLLTFTKFDFFMNPSGSDALLLSNGIGMARNAWVHGDVTVPPIYDTFINPDGSIGSVFDRTPADNVGPLDYYDNNGLGEGVAEGAPWNRIIQLENVQFPKDNPLDHGSPSPSLNPTIEQLAQLVLRGGVFPNYPERDGYDNDGDGGYVTDPVDFIGILAAVTNSEGRSWVELGRQTRFYTRYVPGPLDLDMIDNNLDGMIDNRGMGVAWDIDGNPVDYASNPIGFATLLVEAAFAELNFPGTGDWSFLPNPMISEGVDEGWNRSASEGWRGPGTYSNLWHPLIGHDNTLPAVFINDIDLYLDVDFFDQDLYIDGILLRDPITGAVGFNAPLNASAPLDNDDAITRLGDPVIHPLASAAPYLGSDLDPPDWKAFVERRWNPGDCVIVTLYVGYAGDGAPVADRVTYREFDVINRTIDDQVPCPYVDGGGNPVGLHPDYPTFWPPDQMGLDFYRSLERKDPLYKGDRFGTVNRWQATDGNYDDWAESPSFYERIIETDTQPPAVIGSLYRFDPDAIHTADDKQQLFRHAVWGSPLRMNLAKRISANPDGRFPSADTAANFDWSHYVARHTDRPHQSPGGLLQVPQANYRHTMFNTSITPEPFLYDMTQLNYQKRVPGVAGIVRQDTTGRGVVLGVDPVDLPSRGEALGQVLEMAAQNPLVLSVGQAEFTPILPRPADGNWQDILRWNTDGALQAPAAWTPVFLFASDPDTERTATNNNLNRFPYYPAFPDGTRSGVLDNRNGLLDALFNPDYILRHEAVSEAYLLPRWPLERRTVMYWSAPRADIPAPEALFTWDADDGLENGEYMVYIGTFLPGMQERLKDANYAARNVGEVTFGEGNNRQTITGFQESLLTSFGETILTDYFEREEDRPKRDINLTSPELAIEIITDRSRARGPYAAAAAAPNEPGLVRPEDWTSSMVYRPGADGYILYGNKGVNSWRPQLVHVRDNFLALRVRNVGGPGRAAVITQVVLAPRKRVPGKININTATERVVADGRVNQNATRMRIFNPLLGLPGIVDAIEPLGPTAELERFSWLDPDETSVPWPPLSALTGIDTPPPATLEFGGGLGNNREAGAQLAAMIQAGRPENVDGRYYANIGDLVRDASQFVHRYPNGSGSGAIFPLSNQSNPIDRFEEVINRFRRMANLITVRSDVFEIIVTVQAGYGIDLDGDGHINYRSDEEFVITAEAKSRVVYERRSPSDRSDQAEPEGIIN